MYIPVFVRVHRRRAARSHEIVIVVRTRDVVLVIVQARVPALGPGVQEFALTLLRPTREFFRRLGVGLLLLHLFRARRHHLRLHVLRLRRRQVPHRHSQQRLQPRGVKPTLTPRRQVFIRDRAPKLLKLPLTLRFELVQLHLRVAEELARRP